MAWDFPVKKAAEAPKDETTPATQQIHAWINEELGRKDVGTANRASSAPQCVRKRWFQNQGEPGEQMQPRSILVFATGDVVEHVYKYMIEKACVGPDKLYSEVDFGKKTGTFTIQHREFTTYEQETIITKFNDLEIPGHADGWGKRNSDGKWELIEIKSAASYGFDDFVNGECGYVEQVHALMMSDKGLGLGVTSARFFFMNKNTSHIFDRLYEFDEKIAQKVELEFLAAVGDKMPDVPNDPDIGFQAETFRSKSTGKMKLGWKCSYCPYIQKCWPSAQVEFKSGKPVYYLKEAK